MTEVTIITKPKIHTISGKLYLYFTLIGKQQRKSLHMVDSKENRRISMFKRIRIGKG